ncbi:GRIP and coiled-coil domain-containing protein [Quillaja saponaria]|uniref:GRIP and coiled-coil domain-containing protein n=1 Tax=Quillaja saponaria TaxID=32244 RepID=A0AAD7LU94_QUISA|nr:GRIP and coiled-coil domain-containing protein [Quillaja saponaria]
MKVCNHTRMVECLILYDVRVHLSTRFVLLKTRLPYCGIFSLSAKGVKEEEDRAGAKESEMGRRVRNPNESALTRAVNAVFAFVRLAEFEILFVLFLFIAFLVFKDITSRPEYNQILVKKPGGPDWWPN